MSPPPLDSDTLSVQLEIPAAGDATFTVTPQSLSGTQLGFFTAFLAGQVCRNKTIVTRSSYTRGQPFSFIVQTQGPPGSRVFNARVDNPSPGNQAVAVQLDTRKRDIHTLDAALDFADDGNVVITVDLQPLEQDSQAVSVMSKVGDEAMQASELSSVTFTSNNWQNNHSFELGYTETDQGGHGRTMYGSAGFQPFTAASVQNGLLVTARSN